MPEEEAHETATVDERLDALEESQEKVIDAVEEMLDGDPLAAEEAILDAQDALDEADGE
jgi:hypothetical protein